MKSLWDRIKSITRKNPGGVMALSIFFVAVFVFLISDAFAALTPVKSVIITSEKSSYDEKDAGSWQVKKSGKWVKKGTARITFDVDTVLKTNNEATDIIFVLDISGSMRGEKLDKVKSDSTELVNTLLSDSNNRAALITFDTGSSIVSDFTNNKDDLISQFNNLQYAGDTNYYQALVNVDTILKDYVKEEGRELIVLFLTDGYPNVDNPNQVMEYQYLKETYPYITINGIQYEMGNIILNPVKEISDNQYYADIDTLNNVLFNASALKVPYDKFKIVDYIDNRYFTLESKDDITVSQGSVKLENVDSKQKITWTIDSLKSGSDAKLNMDIKLKNEYIGQGGIYPTNESEEVISRIRDASDEDVVSTKTPILSDNYKVTYDGNGPDGVMVSNVPSEETYYVFDTVSISTKEPSCVGYEFKGWEIVNKDINKVNDDHFIMPEDDVVIRAKWSKMDVSKTMNGEISTVQTLYKIMQDQAVMDNVKSKFVTNDSGISFNAISSNTNGKGVYERAGTEEDKYPIYYYRGDVDNNHVKFANFCWKIVRTTDTGGVKLIYDGVPDSNGVCNNTGEASQIGKSVFNVDDDSPADVGYIYGTRYTNNYKGWDWYSFAGKNSSSVTLLNITRYVSGTNYYYGSSVEYDSTTGEYKLVNPKQKKWNDNYQDLVGYYTCFSSETSCENPRYIGETSSSVAYYRNAGEEMIGLGKSINYQNGIYTITDYQEMDANEYYNNYSDYEGYYICGIGTTNTCSTINYIDRAYWSYIFRVSMSNGETYDSLFSQAETVKWIYGNDVSWDGSQYTLVDTVESSPANWNSESTTLAKKYHYTCLSEDNTCSKVYYINNWWTDSVYYLILSDGDDIESAKNKMFTNANDSDMKNTIETWYESNMTEYTKYLEDTVYCNDRTLYSGSLKGKDADGTEGSYFFTYGRVSKAFNPSTTCSNIRDSFTVSSDIGNGLLTYPVALLTADEVSMAGGRSGYSNRNYYLYTGELWWTLSPYNFNLFNYVNARGYYVDSWGMLNYNVMGCVYGVRPVVSLAPDVMVVNGDGSSEAPYEVMLEEELYG